MIEVGLHNREYQLYLKQYIHKPTVVRKHPPLGETKTFGSEKAQGS